jgi:hypothetical protein
MISPVDYYFYSIYIIRTSLFYEKTIYFVVWLNNKIVHDRKQIQLKETNKISRNGEADSIKMDQ